LSSQAFSFLGAQDFAAAIATEVIKAGQINALSAKLLINLINYPRSANLPRVDVLLYRKNIT
jgi:hypothetical protein